MAKQGRGRPEEKDNLMRQILNQSKSTKEDYTKRTLRVDQVEQAGLRADYT